MRTCLSWENAKASGTAVGALGARCWYTFVPYVPSSAPPLVIDMHGYGASPQAQSTMSGWKELATKHGFVLAYPEGRISNENSRGWDAGKCCGTYAQSRPMNGSDDVLFLRGLIKQEIQQHGINPARVYLTGHSNGCAMAQYMAARSSDIISAVACFSHYLLVEPKNYDPVPVWFSHGDVDKVVRYSSPGVDCNITTGCSALEANHSAFVQDAAINFERWAKMNECDGKVEVQDFYTHVVFSLNNCSHGASVVHVELRGVGHIPYYGYESGVDTTEMAWDFVKSFETARSRLAPWLSTVPPPLRRSPPPPPRPPPPPPRAPALQALAPGDRPLLPPAATSFALPARAPRALTAAATLAAAASAL